MLIRFSLSIACVLGMASAGLAGGITVLTANSHNAEGLEGTVNAFQALLGGDNNGNAAGPIANGRRQINWDAGVVPFDMPANFFNNAGVFPPTRGAVFSTNAGNEFRVSNSNLVKNPGDPVDNLFDSLNSDYANQFISFSNDRIFTPVGTNVMNVKFFVPATDIAATVKGFGAVFTDVDIAGTTKLDFYNVADDLVGTEFAEVKDGGLSFVGASFDDEYFPSENYYRKWCNPWLRQPEREYCRWTRPCGDGRSSLQRASSCRTRTRDAHHAWPWPSFGSCLPCKETTCC